MKFSPGETAILWHPDLGEEGSDFSFLHGEDVEIIEIIEYTTHITLKEMGYDYIIVVPSFSPKLLCAREHELRKKKDGYDGNEKIEWSDCVWSPTRELETIE